MSNFVRVRDIPKRPDPSLVAEFKTVATPHLSDSMERMYAGGPNLRPMHKAGKLVGPAFTVKVAPGDNLFLQKSLDLAQPGDVIVVDGGGFAEQALLGEMMAARAEQRGIAGLVIWGAIRDSAELGAANYPVFAAGITHRGPYKNGPGEINVPVLMGGMLVNPGDIIVGDWDGVVAVPQDMAEQILASAKAVLTRETATLEKIKAGTIDRSWVDRTLKERGYELP